MANEQLNQAFSRLATPLIADAMLRLDIEPRLAPAGIRPLQPGTVLAGRVKPVRHYGSVDIFLEAMGEAESGDILVIDNGARTDEGAIGDLTALEARAQGLAGLIVWGFHRDTVALREIGFPVFSYGTCPFGPRRLDEREASALRSARFGDFEVTHDDVVFADDDGALFAPTERADELLATAQEIWETERSQAEAIGSGKTLYQLLGFADYLKKRDADSGYTFRKHLREIRAAIEE